MDLFLKQSRLLKRRTLAKELCDEGAVFVNGNPVRPGKELAVGDRLSLRLWNRWIEVQIERIPDKPPTAAEARTVYRILSEGRIVDEGP